MIKKRVIISIILTLLAVWGSHNYWLNVKPIDMSFKINGDNIQQVEARLYKYANENSEKFYYHRTDVNVKKHVKFSFKKPYSPKRLKLLISLNSLEGGGALYELNLKRNKIKLNDFENFSAKGATLKVKDNKLYFSPTDKNVLISYNKKLKLNASTKFDFLVLLIIAIITYLFAYKITSYLADFKINKDKSRIDIIFLAIFFLILFIPMMRISNAKTSKSENRTLAVYKPLFKSKGRLNFNYGKDFDNWFSDRFNLRKQMVSLETNLNYKLSSYAVEKNNIFLNKKSHWFTNLIFHQTATQQLSDEELKKYLSNLQNLQNYCTKHNKQLYVFFVPEKGIIYRNEIFGHHFNTSKSENDITRQISDYISEHSDIIVNYPYDLLSEAKKHQLIYYKNDHHMNDYGNLIYFNNFLDIYNKTNGTNIRHLTEKDFNVVKNNKRKIEGNPHRFTNGSEYIAFNAKDPKLLDTTYSHYFAKKEKSQLLDKKVFVLGDSYSMQFKQFFNNVFQENYFLPTHQMPGKELQNVAKIHLKEIQTADVIFIVFAGMACKRVSRMDFSSLNDL